MNAIIKIAAATLVLLFTINVSTPAAEPPDWENQAIFDIGKEPPCSTMTPYPDVKSALKADPASSPYSRSLNGDWKFHFSPNPADRPQDFYNLDFKDSRWKKIPVPSNWQMHAYGIPHRDFNTIFIDSKLHGVGGDNSWGARTHPQYTIPALEWDG